MIVAILIVFGLVLGSFVNALIWRIHEQETELAKKKPNKQYLRALSMSRGRSMCSSCHHPLATKDLVPVFSWLWLRGKCRYCHKPIPDNPLIEISTAAVFVLSYIAWNYSLHTGVELLYFGLWLVVAVGLVALTAYDARWYILPNRIVYPLTVVAGAMAVLRVTQSNSPLHDTVQLAVAVAIGGGIFYLIFHVSNGKWIGGGDVKLGWMIGLLVGTGPKALLTIFIAALLGSIVSVPLLMSGSLKRNAVIPFGPFLIIGTIVTVLFGNDILHWYTHLILLSP